MRQLTASQKIAILENRVAQLEKQAFLEGMKAKILEKLQIFKRLRRQVGSLFKREGSPKEVAQKYVKVSKTPEYKQAMKNLQEQVGPSPTKRISFLLKAENNEYIVRKASYRKNALFYEITAGVLILGVIWELIDFFFGGRYASHNKEALTMTLLIALTSFIIGWFMGQDYKIIKRED